MKWFIISFFVTILLSLTVFLFVGKDILDSKDFLLPGIHHVSSNLVEKLKERKRAWGLIINRALVI